MSAANETDLDQLHQDPENWKLGIVYACKRDPRVVVPNRFWIGWTWNFGHSWVLPAILLAVAISIGPFLIAWRLGVQSVGLLMLVFFGGLLLAIFLSIRLSVVAYGKGRYFK